MLPDVLIWALVTAVQSVFKARSFLTTGADRTLIFAIIQSFAREQIACYLNVSAFEE